MKYDNNKVVRIWAMCVDWIAIAASILLSYFICDRVIEKLTVSATSEFTQYVFIMLFGYVFAYLLCGNYRDYVGRGFGEELMSVTGNQLIMLGVVTVSMVVTKNSMLESRYMYVIQFLLSSVFVYVLRLTVKFLLKKFYGGERRAVLVAILAREEQIGALVEIFKERWDYHIQGLVVTDRDKKGEQIGGYEVVANSSDCMDYIRRTPVDEVIMDLALEEGMENSIVEELEDMGITVHIGLPYLEGFQNYAERITDFGNYAALTLTANNSSNYEKLFVKRLIDIFVGLIGSVISIPIILLVAVPLLIESPGPLFFTQVRVGLNGRRFKIIKLRSMYPDAETKKSALLDQNEMEGPMFKMKCDPRITKVGKFLRATSIDELPQFFNILKGDMSFVGTRPPTEEEFLQYKNHHRRRLSMKPGLTGLWQVSGRSDITNFEEVVRLDVKYIDTWSLKNDLKIILKTVKVVVLRMGSR